MQRAKEVIMDVLPDKSIIKTMLLKLIPERIRYFFGVTMYKKSSLRAVESWIEAAKARSRAGGQGADFMSQMLALSIDDKDKYNESVKKGFTESEVLSNSIISVAAGFETTRASLVFILGCIARHQDVQQKLYDHIEKMDSFSYESLRDFVYLESVIKEATRLYTPVPINGRIANESCTLSNGLTIDKGVS